MPRSLLVSKLRMAAERLDQPHERSGGEPHQPTGRQPSSRRWKWSTLLVQPGEKKNPFCVRPSWHIMTPYAQSTLPEE